jgi:hypothetical protein
LSDQRLGILIEARETASAQLARVSAELKAFQQELAKAAESNARFGQSGSGYYNVIAAEITKLSTTTRTLTADIERLNAQIVAGGGTAVATINATTDALVRQSTVAAASSKVFATSTIARQATSGVEALAQAQATRGISSTYLPGEAVSAAQLRSVQQATAAMTAQAAANREAAATMQQLTQYGTEQRSTIDQLTQAEYARLAVSQRVAADNANVTRQLRERQQTEQAVTRGVRQSSGESTQDIIARTTGAGTRALSNQEYAYFADMASGATRAGGAIKSVGTAVKDTTISMTGMNREGSHMVALLDEASRGQRGQMFSTLGAGLRDAGLGFGSVAVAFGAIAGVAGFERMVKNFADLAMQTRDAAAAAGISVGQYSQLQNVMQIATGSAGALERTFAILHERMDQALDEPLSKAATGFAQLNISADQIAKGLQNPAEMLELLRTRFQALGDAGIPAFEKILGTRDFVAIAGYLRMTDEEFAHAVQSINQSMATMDAETAAKLANVRTHMNELDVATKGLGEALAQFGTSTGIIDFFTHLEQAISGVLDRTRALKGESEGDWLTKTAGAYLTMTGVAMGGPAMIGLGNQMMTPGAKGPTGTAAVRDETVTGNSILQDQYGKGAAASTLPQTPISPTLPASTYLNAGAPPTLEQGRDLVHGGIKFTAEPVPGTLPSVPPSGMPPPQPGPNDPQSAYSGIPQALQPGNIQLPSAALTRPNTTPGSFIDINVLKKEYDEAKAILTDLENQQLKVLAAKKDETIEPAGKNQIAQQEAALANNTADAVRKLTQAYIQKAQAQKTPPEQMEAAFGKAQVDDVARAYEAQGQAARAAQAAATDKTRTAVAMWDIERDGSRKLTQQIIDDYAAVVSAARASGTLTQLEYQQMLAKLAALHKQFTEQTIHDTEEAATRQAGLLTAQRQQVGANAQVQEILAKEAGTGAGGISKMQAAAAQQDAQLAQQAAQIEIDAQQAIIAAHQNEADVVQKAEEKIAQIRAKLTQEEVADYNKAYSAWQQSHQALDSFFSSLGSSFESGLSNVVSAVVNPQVTLIKAGLTTIKVDDKGEQIRAAIGKALDSMLEDAGKSIMKSIWDKVSTKLFGEGGPGGALAKLFGDDAPKAASFGMGGASSIASAGTSQADSAIKNLGQTAQKTGSSLTSVGSSATQSGSALTTAGTAASTNAAATTTNTTATTTDTAATTTTASAKATDTAATQIAATIKTTNTTADIGNTAAVTANSAAQAAAAASASASSGLGLLAKGGGALASALLFSQGGVVPSAAGGMIVGGNASGGMLSILHPNEMVLPKQLSEGVQDMISGKGGGVGGNSYGASINYSPTINTGPSRMTPEQLASTLATNASSMAGIARNLVRRGWRG